MEPQIKKMSTVPGTILTSNNTQLLISSGIPSLDDILGGGLPVGTVTLLEEDVVDNYSNIMLQYFLAEGVISKHSLFLASQDLHVRSFITNLPAVISDKEIITNKSSAVSNIDDKLKIAWRYQNMQLSDPESHNSFGHYYDLSKKMDSSMIEKTNITCWDYKKSSKSSSQLFFQTAYYDLLMAIKQQVVNENLLFESPKRSDTVLRIALHSLGSPLWSQNEHCHDLFTFVYCLRAIVKNSFSSAIITVPSYIINQDILSRCIHSCDNVFHLQSFSGTELEKNSALKDYQGFFKIVKLSAISTLVAKDPRPMDFAFKLRMKKFKIEELHLPPDTNETELKLGCSKNYEEDLNF